MNATEMRRGVRANWRANGVLKKGQRRPGLAIQDIVRAGATRNRPIRIERLESWLVVFDEVASWYLSLFTICLTAIRSRRGRLSLPLARSTAVLVAKIFADLLAIRRLVVEGFDVGAQAVLRSTIEHIETLALLFLDPSLAIEFEQTKDNNTSNQFWNRHLRRGRVRKLLRREMDTLLGDNAAADLDDVIYRDRDNLSMTSHPSMMGGFFAYASLGNPLQDNWPGIFGARSDGSWQTLYSPVLLPSPCGWYAPRRRSSCVALRLRWLSTTLRMNSIDT
jgi:hypothetical protein